MKNNEIDIEKLLKSLDKEEDENMSVVDLVRNSNIANRIIVISDDVDEFLARDVIAALLYLDRLNNDDITMYINTPGGIVTDGLGIYDAMQLVKSDVKTVVIGQAASMGAILLSGGTKGKRFATLNSEVMLHSVSGGARGNVDEIETTTKNIKKTNDKLLNILVKQTNQPLSRLKRVMSKDFFLNANEALEFGIIDGIL